MLRLQGFGPQLFVLWYSALWKSAAFLISDLGCVICRGEKFLRSTSEVHKSLVPETYRVQIVGRKPVLERGGRVSSTTRFRISPWGVIPAQKGRDHKSLVMPVEFYEIPSESAREASRLREQGHWHGRPGGPGTWAR